MTLKAGGKAQNTPATLGRNSGRDFASCGVHEQGQCLRVLEMRMKDGVAEVLRRKSDGTD